MPTRRGARHRVSTGPPADHARKLTRASAASAFALLLVIGLASYVTSFRGVFVYDDLAAIVQNPHVRTLSRSLSSPSDTTLAGRPIASLTFGLNYALAADDVRDVWKPNAIAGSGDDPFLRN